MKNETGVETSQDASENVASPGAPERTTSPARQPKTRRSAMRNRSKRDAELMAFCERRFAKLMAAAEIPKSDSDTGATTSEGHPSPGADAKTAYEQFQEELSKGRLSLNRAQRRQIERTLKKDRSPEIGDGPRVFLGLDAEWVRKSGHKNRILSVQLYLFGPTGEVLTKVIHVSGPHADEERPDLGEVLYDLLLEALDEGVIDDWPSEIVLCGFYLRGDLAAFRDFRDFVSQLDGIGKTLGNQGDPMKIAVRRDPTREARLKTRLRLPVGDLLDSRLLSVRVVDAWSLTPPGKSLDAIGDYLEIPKVKLPSGYTKDRMDVFQRERREEFEAYGLRDAEIAVTYVLWATWFARKHLGLDMDHLTATAGGLAVRLAESCIRRDGVSLDVALNYERKTTTRWNETTNRAQTFRKRLPKQVRSWLEPFLSDAYVGGRNECFTFGPSPLRRFFDPDLSGAYSTGLGYLFVLDYDNVRFTHDLKDFVGHVAGFAQVDFDFPEGTERPCLPVAVDNRGLIFPLHGVSVCTAPEIELAISMGADLKIKFGVIIPWLERKAVFERSDAQTKRAQQRQVRVAEVSTDEVIDELDTVLIDKLQFPPPSHDDFGYRLFESFAIVIRELRSLYRRKTLPFEFIKLLGNSLYGKTGQGFKGKRSFGPREMASIVVGPSRVSDAAVAALVCGFIRAVLGEILCRLPADSILVSVTTDGFLVDRDISQLDLSGPLCQRFQALLNRLSPGTSMLENKHQMMQVFAGRTRLQITTAHDGEHPGVTAKGGVKPPVGTLDENAFMLDLILNRRPGQKITYESLISTRNQLSFGADLVTETHETTLNLEYDFKRRIKPGSAEMVEVAGTGVQHLAFSTLPWNTVEEAVTTRLIFDRWRKRGCLKTLDDLSSFQSFLALGQGNRRRVAAHRESTPDTSPAGHTRGRTGQVNLTSSGYVGMVKRMFLAAYVQRTWGLENVDLSQRQLAEWLTSVGYATSLSAVKNGTHTVLHENAAPKTAEVAAFIALVKARFPGLQTERFFADDCSMPGR